MSQRVLSVVVAVIASWTACAGDDADKGKLTKEEERVLELTNEARKKEGLEPLTANPVLTAMARGHSKVMADKRKLDHVIDGVGPEDRIKKSGYKYRSWAENIQFSFGKRDPASFAVEQWLKSPPHRENLFNKDFTEVGIGVVRNDAGETYFTQVLGAPRK